MVVGFGERVEKGFGGNEGFGIADGDAAGLVMDVCADVPEDDCCIPLGQSLWYDYAHI